MQEDAPFVFAHSRELMILLRQDIRKTKLFEKDLLFSHLFRVGLTGSSVSKSGSLHRLGCYAASKICVSMIYCHGEVLIS